MNIVHISLLLGHEHLETTMIYLDITIEQKAEALATPEDELEKTQYQGGIRTKTRWLHFSA